MDIRAGTELVGREQELQAGRRFLAKLREGAAALLLSGEPGIGKTVLWRRIVEEAEATGMRVLQSRCVESEMPLAFAALGDLLEPVVDEIAHDLPTTQRYALDFALRRAEAELGAPDQLTVSRAVLGTLRGLAAAQPLVVAVDDVQLLDPASLRVLSFALRRLERERIGLLATERLAEEHHAPALAVPGGRVERLEVGPLSFGALQHLLRTRISVSISRPTLLRLHATCGGNPMFALEFARALATRSEVVGEAVLPMPTSLRELVRERVVSLSPELRPLVELVAVLGSPTVARLEQGLGSDVGPLLDEAVESGTLRIDADGGVRFSHPLLGSAVYDDTPPSRRRALHRRAAELIGDEEERARHLALAATDPDAAVAALLDRAAESAFSRGAAVAAAELSEHARRLTPPARSADQQRRIVACAGYLVEAGAAEQAVALLEPLLAAGDVAGPVRAEALLVRADAEWGNRPRLVEFLERALECSGDDPGLHAQALLRYAWQTHIGGDTRTATERAHEALTLAEHSADSALVETAAHLAAFLEGICGQPATALQEARRSSTRVRMAPYQHPPRWSRGLRSMWTGDFAGARGLFREQYEEAERQGSETRLAMVCRGLTELEWWAGDWKLARRYADEGYSIMQAAGGTGEMILRTTKARIAASEGEVEEAVDDGTRALIRAETENDLPNAVRNRWALGFLELSLGNPANAWDRLEGTPELLEEMGIGEPAFIPLVPDAIETLVALDRLEEAEGLVARFEAQAATLSHAWATPSAMRCRALLLLARGDVAGSLAALETAVAGFAAVGYPFDRARALLVAGSALRRAGERRQAAERLQEARVSFERLGARLWSRRAAEELRHAGARPRRDSELTTAEARVAQLVASGSTNKEVASQLFTTVATVEAHLTRIYRKLGLRSRSELAHAVAAGSRRLPDVSE